MDDRTDGRMDERTYYTVTKGIWTRDLQPNALRAITGRAHAIQKAARMNGRRNIIPDI